MNNNTVPSHDEDRLAARLEPILTEGEAAAHIRVSIYTLRSWRRSGKGPAWLRLGEKKPGYKQSSLLKWLENQRGQPTAA